MKSEPIFVRVRNDQGAIYGSYDILWQLIDWNFPSCELDEVEPDSEHIYIFSPTNGNVEACCLRPHRARYILYQLEIPGQVNAIKPDCFDDMIVSCRYWQSLVPEAIFMPLGGDVRLAIQPAEPKEYDFAHLAYLYGRRAQVVSELEAKGFVMAPVGFGLERQRAIAYSRWGLILHQNPVPALSPQRMTLFACSKLPMVAEACDPYPYEVEWLDTFSHSEQLEQANANYTYFTETMTFRKAVEGAL